MIAIFAVHTLRCKIKLKKLFKITYEQFETREVYLNAKLREELRVKEQIDTYAVNTNLIMSYKRAGVIIHIK